MIWLLAGLALAEPATCSTADLEALPVPSEKMALAWVAPWRRRPSGWLTVVPAFELSTWLGQQDPTWTGRTLQWLGKRRRNTDPKRRYQVRIFEAEPSELCRPIATVDAETIVAGVPVCPARLSRSHGQTDGCGQCTDRKTGEPTATRYGLKVAEVKQRGFCVVPLDRYIEQAGRAPR